MTHHELIERVAAGLRNMIETPDALVFSPTQPDETWDEEYIMGIPVYHLDCPVVYWYNGGLTIECPFMPVWKADRSDKQYLSQLLFSGWEDLNYEGV